MPFPKKTRPQLLNIVLLLVARLSAWLRRGLIYTAEISTLNHINDLENTKQENRFTLRFLKMSDGHVSHVLQLYKTVCAGIVWKVQLVFLLDVVGQEASGQEMLP